MWKIVRYTSAVVSSQMEKGIHFIMIICDKERGHAKAEY